MIKMKVKFIANDPTTWGVSKNNAGLLNLGEVYTIEKIEVHSWHTKVFLKEFPGVEFNSAWFEEV